MATPFKKSLKTAAVALLLLLSGVGEDGMRAATNHANTSHVAVLAA